MSKAQTDNNRQPFNNTGTIVLINFLLGYAAILVVVSFWIWPTDPHWWAFGLMSIILCLGATALIARAFNLIRKLHSRDRAIEEIQSRGKAPASGGLASTERLKERGLIK